MQPKKTGCFTWVVAIFCGLMFMGWCASVVSPKAPTTPTSSTPPVPREPDLKATVSFDGTQFVVKNIDDVAWENTRLMVNPGVMSDGHFLNAGSLTPGQELRVGALRFADSDGQRFNPFTTKPMRFRIVANVAGKRRTWSGGFQ